MRHILAYRATLAAGYDHLMADAQDKRSMLALDVKDWTALVGLASIALQSGDLQDEVQRFSGLVERDPVFAQGFYKRGKTCNRLAKLTAALALNPRDAFSHFDRAAVVRVLDRRVQALAAYDQAIAMDSNYVAAYVNRRPPAAEFSPSGRGRFELWARPGA
jgi:tetratricopeptide (TPR) repeat protein